MNKTRIEEKKDKKNGKSQELNNHKFRTITKQELGEKQRKEENNKRKSKKLYLQQTLPRSL